MRIRDELVSLNASVTKATCIQKRCFPYALIWTYKAFSFFLSIDVTGPGRSRIDTAHVGFRTNAPFQPGKELKNHHLIPVTSI
jgi:hypothetical protein